MGIGWLGVRQDASRESASVPCRAWELTRFHDARVQFVLSAGNGSGGQAMRRAWHARLAHTLGGSVPDRFPMRLVEIDLAWDTLGIAVSTAAPKGGLSRVRPRGTVPHA